MTKIKIGYSTITWQTGTEVATYRPQHIMEVVARAGFKGVAADQHFFQEVNDPPAIKELLDKYAIELSAVMSTGELDIRGEDGVEVKLLEHFPHTLMLLKQKEAEPLNKISQQELLTGLHQTAAAASVQGIRCAFDPMTITHDSLHPEVGLRDAIHSIDTKLMGIVLNTGQLGMAGMDPLPILQEYRDMVRCVIFKDVDAERQWASMGNGIIDFVSITNYLKTTGYEGWIIVEDECIRAADDPDSVAMEDGLYARKVLEPLITHKSLTQFNDEL